MIDDKLKNEIFRCLRYYPDNGNFVWLCDGNNGIKKNTLAGHVSGRYLSVSIFGEEIYLHRLAFVFMTGDWPKNDVDHKNRDNKDNRWVNLRDVDMTQNMYNAKLRADNTSGHKGVHHFRNGKWMAYIIYKGKHNHLGYFKTFEEAVAARKMAEGKYYAS